MIKTKGSLSQILTQSALRHKGFRRLWVATLLSSTGRWADIVVVGWLTLELTDSALMVGIVTACKMAGYVLAPLMGVAADRIDRRKLLILASMVSGLISVVMLFFQQFCLARGRGCHFYDIGSGFQLLCCFPKLHRL